MNKAKWQSHISEGQERRKTEGKQQRIAFIFEAQKKKSLWGMCFIFKLQIAELLRVDSAEI